MIILEVKFKQNINGVIKEIPVHGNISTAVLQETLDLSPEGLSEGRLTNVSEEGGRDKKDEFSSAGDADK